MRRDIIILTLVITFSVLGSLLNNVTFANYGAYLWVVPTASVLLVIATLLSAAIWKATTRPIRYASRFFMVLAILQLPMLLFGRLPYTHHVWRTALKKAGLRHRPSYQLRHTFASLCLESGVTPGWLANVLGHSTLQTTFKHYARFIKDSSRENESRLETMLGSRKSTSGKDYA